MTKNSKFNPGDKAFIIESSIFVKEVEIVSGSGAFYVIRYPKKSAGYKVRESRLYKTEEEAKEVIKKNKTSYKH